MADDSTQQYDEQEQTWTQAVPGPFYTTTGLPFWKRFNEKNWRPQCLDCKEQPIFDTDKEYRDHRVFKHSGKAPHVQQ